MFSANGSSPEAREIVWKYLQDKWSDMKERFSGQFIMARMIDVSGSGEGEG